MKYWEDMNSKYGFNDGASTPAGAELYREAYVKTMNHLLARFNSGVRVVGYDRGGLHNGVIIFNVPVSPFETLSPDVQSGKEPCPDSAVPFNEPEVATDDAFDLAYEAAFNQFEPDCYVNVDVSLERSALEEDLAALITEGTNVNEVA